jgi:ABC-type lipoprotein export system ATPase subunit
MTLLVAENLWKTYTLGRAAVPVLRGASVAVERGEFVAVLGASGSGKSTLLHLLGGLDRPDRVPGIYVEPNATTNPAPATSAPSRIEFDGVSLASLSVRGLDAYRTRSVGFVFQFYHLLPELSVEDNVLLPSMVAHGRFGYMARRRDLRLRAQSLLDDLGLSHRLRHRPVELSGGERQRAAIARALINDPPLLLADEPTGNLDAATGAKVLDALLALRAKSGRTMLIVTHDANTAARADRVVRIVDGRVAAG